MLMTSLTWVQTRQDNFDKKNNFICCCFKAGNKASRNVCVQLLIWPVWCWNWTLTWSWWDYGRSHLVWPSGRRWLSAWVTEPTSLTCPWWHNSKTVCIISRKENVLISFLNMEPFYMDPDRQSFTVLKVKSVVLINASWDLQFSSFFL